MAEHLWISTRKWTCYVRVRDGKIHKDTAPLLKTFIGQPIENLRRWARKFGGYMEVSI